MKKHILLIALLTFGLISCKTTDSLYTSLTGNGDQLNFLRPFSVKTENDEIDDLSMDITVISKISEIKETPVLKYTFRKKISKNVDVENITVGLICGTTELLPENKSNIYKNIAKDKYLEVRYTTDLDKDTFSDLLETNDPWYVLLIYSDGHKEIIDSEELTDRILKLKIILK